MAGQAAGTEAQRVNVPVLLFKYFPNTQDDRTQKVLLVSGEKKLQHNQITLFSSVS